ncbi:MAG: ATP-binding protein, partial [Sulfuricella sp.]
GHATVIRELVVPVRRGNKLSAILGVGNKPSDYTESDVGTVLLIADLTGEIAARKRTEEQLRAASLYTRSLIEASPDPLVTISAAGKITDVNEATVKATGATREALLGSDFSNYFTEPDKARAGYQEVFAKEVVTDYPLALRHTSGSAMEVFYNASVYRNEKGEVAGVFAAARDVTRVRQAERLTRERVKELQAFFHLSELVARKDFPLDRLCQALVNVLPGSWQYPETACARIVIGGNEFRTANFDISEWMQAAPVKVLGSVAGKVEVGYLKQKPEEDEGPFLKEERQLIEAIAERVGQIAELKRAEEALKQALAELRELNETLEQRVDQAVRRNLEQERMLVHQSRQAAMGEMIGNIAHQWRQPLNALNIILANIKDSYAYNELTAEEMEQYVARGRRLTQKMSDTIDDFRNFFRPTKEKVPFSLKQALEDTLDLLGASLKVHDIEVMVEGEMEVAAYGFPNEYSQVLVNILNNAKDVIAARKITKGEIRVRIAQEGGTAVMAIRDNGGGIPEDVLPRMFEAYFTTKEQGTGIGLYMSKLIIENNMGGQLFARNVAGGAEFTVICPLAPEAGTATAS